MKLFYFTLLGLFLTALSLSGQAYLQAEEGLKVAYFAPESKAIQAFEMNMQYFYYSDGDTIYQVDPLLAGVSKKYGKPVDYEVEVFPSFMSISPDGRYIWAGYSDLANEDARIYKVDVASGVWKQMAKMPSNWDLVFWKAHVLVSGLNSADFMTPSGIFLLDTMGANSHRKIVEVGGSSAGIAVDMQDNLCFGTSSFTDPNALYRISSADLGAVIDMPGAAALELDAAEKLTELPMGLYDCEVDAGGNVLFTMNLWGGTNVLGQWNGTSGVGVNYDTLAVSAEWLGMVKSRGDYSLPSLGNSLFTLAYGQALADLHTTDYPPVVLSLLPVIAGFETEALAPIDLSQ
ncbi:MAG: hypothetical protein QNK35_06655 [Bacteroides sp.]|nr:hypothetical protein [Bacteroides sp.]